MNIFLKFTKWRYSVLKCYKTKLIFLFCIFLTACATSQDADIKDFEILKSIDPCWVQNSPDKCKDLKATSGNSLFFKGKIVTNKKSNVPDNEQNKQLLREISIQYLKYFQDNLKDSFFKTDGCIDNQNAEICNDIFLNHSKSNSSELLSTNFEFIDYYFRENGKKWDLFALCKIHEHKNKLSTIMKQMMNDYEYAKEQERESNKTKDNPEVKWYN